MLDERVPGEIIAEEIVPEEKILEEKIPEERITEERKEERIERIIIEKKDKAVQTDDDIGESSSESIYSYSMYIIYLHIASYFYYKRMSSNARNLFYKSSVKIIIDTCTSLSRRITRDRNRASENAIQRHRSAENKRRCYDSSEALRNSYKNFNLF